MENYPIEWNAKGIDFNYSGSVSVFAYDRNAAEEKAIKIVSRKLAINKDLISIKR